MPVQISSATFTYIYFANVMISDGTTRLPYKCTPFALSAGDLKARRFDLDDKFFMITPGATGLVASMRHPSRLLSAFPIAQVALHSRQELLWRVAALGSATQ
jgi:hypothetical protein